MTRTKQFEDQDVLAKAMWAFWTKGYQGTSMQDLVEAMGINRFSIYQSFQNKRGLFLASLEKYMQEIVQPQTRILLESEEGMEAIDVFLRTFVNLSKSGKFPNGCFIINSIVEWADSDVEVSVVIHKYLGLLEKAFEAALSRAIKLQEISALHDSTMAAKHLVAVYQSLGVLVKVYSEEDLNRYLDQQIRIIRYI